MPVTPRKLNVGFVSFAYGGNGGISSEHPCVREWMLGTFNRARADKRIDRLATFTLSDTPITMTRNKAVLQARQEKLDVLVMIDSDQHPDVEAGRDPCFKPFFASSFDFLYSHYDRGPVCIGAPYCGPPPVENVYVFRWANEQSDMPDPQAKLEGFCRAEAASLTGIQPVAALPTGLTMWDMRCFEYMTPPWFYYEWKDEYHSEKASTEDVTATRDLSLSVAKQLGYDACYCNWDAWAGHWKPKCVRKPQPLCATDVGEHLAKALQEGRDRSDRLSALDTTGNLPPEIAAQVNGYKANGVNHGQTAVAESERKRAGARTVKPRRIAD